MASPYSHSSYGAPAPPPKRRSWVIVLVVSLFALLICCPIGVFAAFRPDEVGRIVRQIGSAFS
jgi:ABC-type dipeptide/oligopeptide/nickel transport system permease component